MSSNLPGDSAASLNDDRAALADLARRERFFDLLRASLADRSLVKLVLGKPRGSGDTVQRITARPLVLRGQACLSFTYRHPTKDIVKNPTETAALAELQSLLGTAFSHAHLFTRSDEWQLMISKRGKIGLVHSARPAPAEAAAEAGSVTDEAAEGHDRQKRRYLSLDTPFLQALGVTDARHALVPAMARKWKQINKFIEVLDHALGSVALNSPDGQIRVVDFGSGKGYLTFAMHHHLSTARGLRAEVTGVELRQDMVDLCNAAAKQCGMAGLQFLCGDVRSHVPQTLDVMIALHACDVATDHALHTGIRAGAALIMCSPCCHKQIRPQMQLPPLLKPMLQHGIHLGQQAEMVTDSLRALLLEANGYEAQVFEFVALEHTSKNKMILAVRRPAGSKGEAARQAAVRQQIDEIKAFYGIQEHCLERLLQAPAPLNA
ncbi:class I SAM-dependent methyltransferase [Ideonella sp.]|uniref:class I SAM-dependent methyltransferase n=1 Tax=Ideonella sp. TaxID=1929293 RepID=UPI003BB71CF4